VICCIVVTCSLEWNSCLETWHREVNKRYLFAFILVLTCGQSTTFKTDEFSNMAWVTLWETTFCKWQLW
jgi:hypothetical protein